MEVIVIQSAVTVQYEIQNRKGQAYMRSYYPNVKGRLSIT